MTGQTFGSAEKRQARKALTAGMAGNVIEWYDFAVYGYLAKTIASIFFDQSNPTAGLLGTFAVFAIAYFARPVGAVLFGHIGDRLGRRTSLSVSIILMGVATCGIGLLPSYRTIGLAAPILLVLCRLLQGLSVGGEFGGASTFVIEHSRSDRRGFMASLLQTSTVAGLLLGALVGTLLNTYCTPDQLATWGWRTAFLLAGPLTLVGLWLRMSIEDSPEFRQLQATHQVREVPVVQIGRDHGRSFLLAAVLLIGWLFAGGVILVYLPTWLQTVRSMSPTMSLLLTFGGLSAYLVMTPFSGLLSDRFGRKPVMIMALVGLAVVAYPMFWIMLHGAPWLVLAADIVLLAFFTLFGGPVPAILSEMFPTAVRASGIAISYALTVAIFQGNAPLAMTWLIDKTSYALAPGLASAVLCIPSLLVALRVPETAKTQLN